MGGHASAILEKTAPEGKLLGVDLDRESLNALRADLNDKDMISRCALVEGNFADVARIAQKHSFAPVNGILMDLGWSSWQLEKSGRGFGIGKDENLDMRFSPDAGISAADVVNGYAEDDLEVILREFGEERYSRRIARQIAKSRKSKAIRTAGELAAIIADVVPAIYRRSKIHPATRTFQALRIEVNKELENLKKGLLGAHEILAAEGKLAVISFHSLEDRIVKRDFREKAKVGEYTILTRKPVIASDQEMRANPRARSAKLRAVKKA